MELSNTLALSAAGMNVQTIRLRVIAENLANQNTTGPSPGADAYRRKTITFESHLDGASGLPTVQVKRIGEDKGEQTQRYDPANPGADAQGYVKIPNVNTFVEIMDMREAERSYNANLSVLQVTRTMLNRTIELLK